MFKKYCLLFLSILFISGCETKYELQIQNDNTLYEMIQLTLPNDHKNEYNDVSTFINEKYKELVYNSQIKDYSLDIESDQEKTTGTMKRYYKKPSNFNESYMVNTFFKKYYSIDNGEILSLHFSEYSGYDFFNYQGEAIKPIYIDFVIENKVLKHNADKVVDNRYTWVLDSKTKEKEILIHVDNTKKYINIQTQNNNIITFIFLFGSVSILIFLLLYYKKTKKNNLCD